ncbi:MAG: metalloregulator ArsR/SmtB family transcription factor [Marinobacter sp.]|nr:metalloregulator ArsR/SmtB family transcription factor [Marinobacter sp.]
MFPPELAQFLDALASPNRQRILLLFARGETLSVSEIAARVELSMATVSAHLKALRQGGLLMANKQGKEVFYGPNVAVVRERMAQLQQYLSRCC